MVEEVLAGLEGSLAALAAQKFKRQAAAHDAILGQQARDGALRGAAGNVHVDPLGGEALVGLG